MIVEILQLFVESITLLKDTLNEKFKSDRDKEASSFFLDLYSSVKRLSIYTRRVIDKSIIDNDERNNELRKFFAELDTFEKNLKNANTSAIEIFEPQLAKELRNVVVVDVSFIDYYTIFVKPKYKVESKNLKKLLELYARNYNYERSKNGIELQNIRDIIFCYYNSRRPNTEFQIKQIDSSLMKEIKEIDSILHKLQILLSDCIRNNFSLKDLVSLPNQK